MTRSLITGNVLSGWHGDRLVSVEVVHARHARELRLAVDLHAARAALAGLAVPAQREVVGLRAPGCGGARRARPCPARPRPRTSLNSPPSASPRQTLNSSLRHGCSSGNVRADLAGLEIFDLRVRDRDEVRRALGLRVASRPPSRRPRPCLTTTLYLTHSSRSPGKSSAGVRAAALLAHQRRAGDRLGRDRAASASRAPRASPGCTGSRRAPSRLGVAP